MIFLSVSPSVPPPNNHRYLQGGTLCFSSFPSKLYTFVVFADLLSDLLVHAIIYSLLYYIIVFFSLLILFYLSVFYFHITIISSTLYGLVIYSMLLQWIVSHSPVECSPDVYMSCRGISVYVKGKEECFHSFPKRY